MPRRNQIELQGLIDRVVEMFHDEKMTHAQIAEKLRAEGYAISKSGVGRTIKRADAVAKEYRKTAAETAELVKALKNIPGTDIMEASSQLLQARFFEEIRSIESLSELDSEALAALWSKVSLTQVRIGKLKLDYARGYKQGLFDASKVIEDECKKAGISPEVIKAVKSELFLLQTGDDTNGQK